MGGVVVKQGRDKWRKGDERLERADEYALEADASAFEGRFEEAEEKYRKALELMPQNADLWAFRGIVLAGGLKREGEAMRCWERAEKLDPLIGEMTAGSGPSSGAESRELRKIVLEKSCRRRIRELMEETGEEKEG